MERKKEAEWKQPSGQILTSIKTYKPILAKTAIKVYRRAERQ